ncbi:MAG: condensation domain-containing protein, partial [Bacillus sp. (in: firmicutes)]
MSVNQYPLTDAASGIWYAHHMTGSALYNTAEYVRIEGNIDTQLLLRAVNETVASAQALHIECYEEEGEVRQRFKHSTSFRCEYEQSLTYEIMKQKIAEDVSAVLSLQKDQLVRAILFSPQKNEHFLYLRIHHLVSDAYSFRLIYQQISERYNALVQNVPFKKSFGDYKAVIEEDRQYKTSKQYEEDRIFWLQQLEDVEVVSLTDVATAHFGEVILRQSVIEKDIWMQAQKLAKQLKIHVQQLFTAAVATYMKRLTGVSTVILSVPMMGRFGTTAMNVPCTKVNIIPFRVDIESQENFSQICRQVKQQM